MIDQLFQEGESRSFCEKCRHHVHDLSALTAPERQALMKDHRAGKQVCVAWQVDPAGLPIPGPPPAPGPLRRLLSLLLPLNLAGCSTLRPPQPCEKPATITSNATSKVRISRTGGMPSPPP